MVYEIVLRLHCASFRVNRSLLNRLRHNKNVEVNTIDRLCNILGCKVEDIMEHVPDDNKFSKNRSVKLRFCFALCF